MDLFLMDLILKGNIPQGLSVLDIGCGSGRNALYFLQNNYAYHGWDTDESQIRLLEYLASSISTDVKPTFEVIDFKIGQVSNAFDLVICSQVLHFAQGKADFMHQWKKLSSFVKPGGIIYMSMDSLVDTNIATPDENGIATFPDSKMRFVLTSSLYKELRRGFEELEPLKTFIAHGKRAQSFFTLKKTQRTQDLST